MQQSVNLVSVCFHAYKPYHLGDYWLPSSAANLSNLILTLQTWWVDCTAWMQMQMYSKINEPWWFHLSVLEGSWYRPPVPLMQFGHSCFGPGKGKADNPHVCQSRRFHSNPPGSAHRSCRQWSRSIHTNLKQKFRQKEIGFILCTPEGAHLWYSIIWFDHRRWRSPFCQ